MQMDGVILPEPPPLHERVTVTVESGIDEVDTRDGKIRDIDRHSRTVPPHVTNRQLWTVAPPHANPSMTYRLDS
ncbi:hypothetical protein GCM10009827_112290 [Dactylosporangium maewongense]|uniref:Uncharacterized protein n=1 Tax=Dactylosporangium maewongense TaxID=634393 RepID=A0ABP4P1A8_9ACTN